ncbi:hypothetical protein JE86ST05C_06420 [Escherichia coli]|nr:hypothetical protein JE86ST05C_06420 [Escherichia coli]
MIPRWPESWSLNGGDQMQCRDQIEEAAIVLGMVTKSGPEWALNLPLSQLYRHCRQTEKILRTKQ